MEKDNNTELDTENKPKNVTPQGEEIYNENKPKNSYSPKKLLLFLGISLLLLGTISAVAILSNKDELEEANLATHSEDADLDSEHSEADHTYSDIDLTKLPLGDDKYTTSPKKGYVYSCQTSFNGGGAFTQGPWINTDNDTWDLTEKVEVDGSVEWPQATWSSEVDSNYRTIASKDLPTNHTTGTFPVSEEDDAYKYDRNPNSISSQTISFQVPKDPVLLLSPKCIGGEVGIATTGVLIFNAFDAAGRDAVATEVQDSCEGHPQAGSYYHYHGYSSCFIDKSDEGEHSELLGYAFDGFGIFGLKGEEGAHLSSDDLDECHGHTHKITWDGEEKEMYHYHMTYDFPYTVSCFRGDSSVEAQSSGEGGGSQQMQNMLPPRKEPARP